MDCLFLDGSQTEGRNGQLTTTTKISAGGQCRAFWSEMLSNCHVPSIQSERCKEEVKVQGSAGGRCCQLPSWMVLVGKARIWTTQRGGPPAAPVTDRPTLLSLTDLLHHTALLPFKTRLKYTYVLCSTTPE